MSWKEQRFLLPLYTTPSLLIAYAFKRDVWEMKDCTSTPSAFGRQTSQLHAPFLQLILCHLQHSEDTQFTWKAVRLHGLREISRAFFACLQLHVVSHFQKEQRATASVLSQCEMQTPFAASTDVLFVSQLTVAAALQQGILGLWSLRFRQWHFWSCVLLHW